MDAKTLAAARAAAEPTSRRRGAYTPRLTETELAARIAGAQAPNAKPAKHKFGAQAVISAGVRHDSKAEARRWDDLLLAQHAGVIRGLDRQVRIRLLDGKGQPYLIRSEGFPRGRRATWVADFRYQERDPTTNAWIESWVLEDVKGFDTPTSRLKRAIVERMLGVEIRIVRERPSKARRRRRRHSRSM